MKLVHKRNGEYIEEPGETLYIVKERIKPIITFVETSNRFGDKDVTLKDYLTEYNKVYREVCELLKKTLS